MFCLKCYIKYQYCGWGHWGVRWCGDRSYGWIWGMVGCGWVEGMVGYEVWLGRRCGWVRGMVGYEVWWKWYVGSESVTLAQWKNS